MKAVHHFKKGIVDMLLGVEGINVNAQNTVRRCVLKYEG